VTFQCSCDCFLLNVSLGNAIQTQYEKILATVW